MKKEWLVKTLAIGIILLFIGFSITSGTGGNTEIKNNQLPKEMHANFPLSDGLLAYWKSDECNGTTLWDCSGHNYNGTIYGASWTPGCCLVFDGIDDYVDFDNHSENLGYNKTDDYIISVWFKSTSSSTGTIYGMSHTDSAKAFAYLDLNANGTLSYRTGNETCELAVFSAGTYNDGCWHYAEVKFLGDPVNPTLKMYIDGILEGSITDWLNPYLSEDFKTAKMGRRSTTTTNYFDGIINEVKIYKYPRGNTLLLPPLMWTENFSTFYILTPNAPNISDVYYLIDWGDGDITGWIGPYDLNETASISYEWDYDGIYQILVKVKNQAGEIGFAIYSLSFFSDFKFFHPSIVWVDIIYKFTIQWKGFEYYIFDWGDGNLSVWFTGIISYKWSFPGIYELKLKAKDIYGYETPWSEPYVIAIQPPDNQPPNEPRINGKAVGRPGTYKYTFNVTDPNGDNVSYYIDWSDGTFEFWTGWYPSGEKVTIEHTYSKFGKYIVVALAKDIYGLKGPLGYLEISIQRNNQMINLLFFHFLERFYYASPIVRFVVRGGKL